MRQIGGVNFQRQFQPLGGHFCTPINKIAPSPNASCRATFDASALYRLAVVHILSISALVVFLFQDSDIF